MPIQQSNQQLTTIAIVTVIWLTIGRLRRVQLQVAQDDQETTFAMFQKLKAQRFYDIAFIMAFVAFQLYLVIDYFKAYKEYLDTYGYGDP